MTRILIRTLWIAYAIVASAGLAVLSEALFVRHAPEPFRLPAFSPSDPVLRESFAEGLAGKRMTRRVAGTPGPSAPPRAATVPIDRLIRLTGILDFSGKRPSLALIETPATNETKAYQSGDPIGETGVILREIKEGVIVEYEKQRFKVTYGAIQEIPAGAVGAGGYPK